MDHEKKNGVQPEEETPAAMNEAVTEEPAAASAPEQGEEAPVLTEEIVEETAVEEQAAPVEPIQKKKPKKPKKDSRKGKFRGISFAFTAGLIVLIVLLNVVVSILGERYPSMNLDLTTGKVNTLSESAAQVASNVQTPTTITIMAGEDIARSDTNYQQVSILADKMAERNSNITVAYLELDKNPAFASQYQDENITTGSVLVETEKRHRVLNYGDLFSTQYSMDGSMVTYSKVDSALASAVSSVNADTLPLAVFDGSHSEAVDLAVYRTLLEGNNFETQDFQLLTEEIPENAQLLVLGTPTTDCTPDEIEKLEAFLNDETRGTDRSLLVTFHPNQAALPNLTAFLKEWGLDVQQATEVVESDANSYIPSGPGNILVNIGSDVVLNSNAQGYNLVVMPQSSPINLLFDERNGITTHSLATSNSTSYLFDGTQESFDNPQMGSYNVAAMAQKQVGQNTANVVAIGSTFMFDDGILNVNTYGNGSFVTDLSRYVTGVTGSEAVSMENAQVRTAELDISMSLLNVTLLGLGVFTILLPLCVAVIGLVIYIRRRRL
ncbi:Gldg family protein [Anaeromassilibacillus senegalensis]|uniref:Gldg family protein n=1 Tax=Anaeromassilibacillus senegalensis TaxID=1673717 RepID=UPI0006806805|nr:Gldg family protein [Anaeromassilibacillus senegalensis]